MIKVVQVYKFLIQYMYYVVGFTTGVETLHRTEYLRSLLYPREETVDCFNYSLVQTI